MLFSYGSGLASSMFALRASNNCDPDSVLARLHDSLSDLTHRLESRKKTDPVIFDNVMKLREETHHLGKLMPMFEAQYFRIIGL